MDPIYIVTDIEFDGPIPGRNSMLSFGSVATTSDGAVLGEFEATLHPLDNATTDDETTAFWQTQPAAFQAATCDPRPAALVMPQFVHWIRVNLASQSSLHIPLAWTVPGSTTIYSVSLPSV